MIDKKTIIFAAIIFIATIASAFFLNATGLGIQKFLDFEFWINFVKNIASKEAMGLILNLAGLILVFPLIYTSAIAAVKKDTSLQAIAACSISSAAAAILSLLLFPNFQYYWIIAIFFIASVPIAIQAFSKNIKEYVEQKASKSINFAVQRGMLVIIIGCFVFGVAVLMPQNQTMVLQTEYKVVEYALAQTTATPGGIDLSEKVADMLIQYQGQMLSQIVSTEQYQKLKTKTDPDVIAYTAGMDAIEQQLQNPVFRQQLVQQIKQNQDTAIEQAGLDKETMVQAIRKQPMFQIIEPLFWLLLTILLITIMGILRLLTGILGTAYTIILDKALPEETQIKRQN